MKRITFSSSPASRALQVLVWAAALTVGACDNNVSFTPTMPDWPAGEMRLSMISGNNQAGTAGQPLDAPFVVRVVDQHGGAVSGAVVGWDIVEGEGDLPAAPKGPNKLYHETKTDARGVASIVLTLGPRPGQNVVEAKVMFGAGSATFVATGMEDG